MSETMKLEPCPFGCGDTAIRCENRTGVQMHWVMCNACHASPGDRPTEAEAIAAWNRRSHPATGRPTREEVARIVDPWAFDVRIGEMGTGRPDQRPHYREIALAKADQILSLFAPSPPPGDPE